MKNRKELEGEMGVALKIFSKKLREGRGFSGRLWAIGRENPFLGSHSDFGRDDEYVTVFVKDGKVVVAEYVRSQETRLGQEIKKVLLENDILVND